MVKFNFFVHCSGWAEGGYENASFAETKEQALEIISAWNKERPNSVTLISIKEITLKEFAEDFIY